MRRNNGGVFGGRWRMGGPYVTRTFLLWPLINTQCYRLSTLPMPEARRGAALRRGRSATATLPRAGSFLRRR